MLGGGYGLRIQSGLINTFIANLAVRANRVLMKYTADTKLGEVANTTEMSKSRNQKNGQKTII